MALSPKVYTWLCGLFASLGSIIFGYDLGVIAGVLSATDFIDTMGSRFNDPNLEGLITSILLLGCFAGMFPVAYFADNLGRRKTIQIGALVYMLGGALQTGARNMDMMWAGRFFAGFGIGIMADLAPLYQAEIAHPSIRGRLTTLQQFMLGIGAFAASWITYGTSAGLKGTQAEWRVPLGIQIVPALPLFAFILLLPESPRWLAEKGRLDEATKTLAKLHAHGNINDPFVVSQMEDIKAEIQRAREIGSASWSELITDSSNLRRVSLGYILQFSVQMTGVSAIQYYSTTIFTTMGFSATRVLLFQSINSVIALIGEACCVLWVDNTGRRLPMITGNIVSGLSFVVGSILMARWPGTVDNNAAHYIFIITTWVFNFFFSSCIGPLSWAYPAEIYSTRTRAKATAVTSSASWISNFFIAQVTPVAFTHIGWKYYLVFAICGHTNALFVWAFYPETTGRRLEEMDALFHDAPVFVANTPYANKQDRLLAEKELRQGTFVPGDLSERSGYAIDEEKGSYEHHDSERVN
ncbi:general substrate transporter [Lentinula raphanica]|uniref:General substrate transporter n=1 Tax=Lentinula raphanica TaxID=153919 RepID=A0AA38UJR3_9AGAR|nr:general substrate transporter [Lentinula raphanica]KAJ3977124.1 general substrate transporter [Lentinula raphanica]